MGLAHVGVAIGHDATVTLARHARSAGLDSSRVLPPRRRYQGLRRLGHPPRSGFEVVDDGAENGRQVSPTAAERRDGEGHPTTSLATAGAPNGTLQGCGSRICWCGREVGGGSGSWRWRSPSGRDGLRCAGPWSAGTDWRWRVAGVGRWGMTDWAIVFLGWVPATAYPSSRLGRKRGRQARVWGFWDPRDLARRGAVVSTGGAGAAPSTPQLPSRASSASRWSYAGVRVGRRTGWCSLR